MTGKPVNNLKGPTCFNMKIFVSNSKGLNHFNKKKENLRSRKFSKISITCYQSP